MNMAQPVSAAFTPDSLLSAVVFSIIFPYFIAYQYWFLCMHSKLSRLLKQMRKWKPAWEEALPPWKGEYSQINEGCWVSQENVLCPNQNQNPQYWCGENDTPLDMN